MYDEDGGHKCAYPIITQTSGGTVGVLIHGIKHWLWSAALFFAILILREPVFIKDGAL